MARCEDCGGNMNDYDHAERCRLDLSCEVASLKARLTEAEEIITSLACAGECCERARRFLGAKEGGK